MNNDNGHNGDDGDIDVRTTIMAMSMHEQQQWRCRCMDGNNGDVKNNDNGDVKNNDNGNINIQTKTMATVAVTVAAVAWGFILIQLSHITTQENFASFSTHSVFIQ